MKILLFLLLISFNFSTAQKKDPDKILEEAKKTFEIVNDYVVDVNIKVDVDFLKVPETEAKIYYKEPNKVHLESDGFALLPKDGMDFSPLGLLKDEYTAIYERTDTIEGNKTDVVKVIPLGDANDIILTTLWIDESMHIIRKVESTPKIGGTFKIELKYDISKTEFPLPSTMIFSFNVDKLDLPRGISGEMNEDSQELKMKNEKKKNEKKSTEGKVYITYKNYKVNKGIPDSVFEEKKK